MEPPSSLARRGFLRGARAHTPRRPPAALPEPAFLQRCTRCGDCLRACPEQIIVAGAGGFPELVAARGECTFCAACSDACVPAALDLRGARPWRWQARVEDAACLNAQGISCQSCRDACPAAAVQLRSGSRAAAAIDAQRCTGCAACVGVCPAQAVSLFEAAAEALPA